MALLFPCAAALLLAVAAEQPPSPKIVEMYVRNGIAELGLDRATPAGRERIVELEAAVRAELRDRALIEAEAVRRKLPVAAQLPARTRQWVTRFGGDAGYRAYLAEHSLTADEFRRVIEQEIAADLLREALASEVRVSDDEVAAFYERERGNAAFATMFVAPATVTASHILVAARTGLHPDIDARRARAEALLDRLARGENFAALAREHSDDTGTRARGGDLGTFTRETHTATFDEAAFSLAPGQTSPVIQTEFGFHIIRVTAAAPRRIRTLEEQRPVITAHLTARKSAQYLRTWLEQRRAETSTASLPTEKR